MHVYPLSSLRVASTVDRLPRAASRAWYADPQQHSGSVDPNDVLDIDQTCLGREVKGLGNSEAPAVICEWRAKLTQWRLGLTTYFRDNTLAWVL